MYCERCGAQLVEGSRFCASCGKPQGVAVVHVEQRGRVQQHIQTMAVLWIVYGVLALLGACMVFAVGHAVLGSIFRVEGAPFPVRPLAQTIFTIIATWGATKGLLSIVAGWGLLDRQSWARPLTIVASFVAILSIPFGTALGIYSLWVMMPDTSGQEYEALSRAA